MVSISTDKWRTPRPKTLKVSAESVSSILRARFFSNSFSKRSLRCLEVTYFPSLPKKGESFIVKIMLMVGSSIFIGGNASGFSISAIVSPISNPSIPLMAHISPTFTCLTLIFPSPSKTYNSLIFVFICELSLFMRHTGIFSWIIPRCTRPIAIRPV